MDGGDKQKDREDGLGKGEKWQCKDVFSQDG